VIEEGSGKRECWFVGRRRESWRGVAIRMSEQDEPKEAYDARDEAHCAMLRCVKVANVALVAAGLGYRRQDRASCDLSFG
jgi:hypothetical protein